MYDDLLHICDKLHVLYKDMKIKCSSLKKDFTHMEKTHSMTMIKLEKVKMSFDELKIKKNYYKI